MAALTAVGFAVSTLTKSQVVAAVGSFVVFLLLFVVACAVHVPLGLAQIAREWWAFGERAAWFAAALAGLTGLFTFYEILILQASIDAFLTSAASPTRRKAAPSSSA